MDTGFRIRNRRDFTRIPGKKEKFYKGMEEKAVMAGSVRH